VYTWDTVRGGSLSAVESAGVATVSYGQYDALGRVKRSVQAVAGQSCGGESCEFQYSYNRAGGLESVRYPSGRTVAYEADAAGRVATVSGTLAGEPTTYASLAPGADPANPGVTLAGYAAHGGIQRLALAAGRWVERTGYNERLQVQSIQMGAVGTPASVSGFSLSYCPGGASSCAGNNGNVLSQSITPLGVTQTYGYDGVNRLVTASEGTVWSQPNGFDQWGNRWVEGPVGLPPDGETPASQSAFDPWHNWINDGQYDPAGNRRVYGAYALAYDGENRLKTASRTVGGEMTYEWEYDGEGRRVLMKTNGLASTLFVYDAAGQLAAEYGGPADGGTWYLGVDHLGSTRLMLQAGTQGDQVRRYDYLPYGPELLAGGRTPELGYGLASPRQRFTGRERDVETGLDYFVARYYSPAQGRFTSPDPIYFQAAMLEDPQRFNLYAYTRDNPLRYVDPTGKAIELSSDQKTRDEQLKALCEAIGTDSCHYLYSNREKDRHGNLTGRYFVGVLTGGPSGKRPAFENLNAVTKKLWQVINDPQIVKANLVNPFTSLPKFLTGGLSLQDLGYVGCRRGRGIPGTFRFGCRIREYYHMATYPAGS
jgi:RHS repeat-associated protein